MSETEYKHTFEGIRGSINVMLDTVSTKYGIDVRDLIEKEALEEILSRETRDRNANLPFFLLKIDLEKEHRGSGDESEDCAVYLE